MTDGSATSHLFRPKLLTTLREGYRAPDFRCDALAGATVAIVALPLSMAIAVASGVSPERGLYAAIIGGALVSALGGSRFQIGGPAGAFIVLVASTVGQVGVQGLLLTVLLSGLMLTLLGVVRIGALVRHIPHAVTVGFSCGIAVTIFASQIKDIAGLKLTAEPGRLVAKVLALWSAAGTFSWSALMVGLGTAAGIFVLRHVRPHWPGMLIAVTLASAVAGGWGLPVETIGDRFGALPRGLPSPELPDMNWDLLWTVMPWALSFTLLGGVESLLSAKIADTMTGRKHRSNMELVAQGIANIGSAIFGGICVTGTIARTATNIRAGARSPLAGILHAGFLLVFLVFAAPAAGYVPLAALAGLLLVVCWNMAEKQEFGQFVRRRQIGGQELDAAVHQSRDEFDVAGKTVELGDDQHRAMNTASRHGFLKLRSIHPLAAFHFGVFADQRIRAARDEARDRQFLRFEPETRSPLPGGTDPVVRYELPILHETLVASPTAKNVAVLATVGH